MSEIRVKEGESLESALRRFKRSTARSGVLAEVRKREAYEKPSVKRKKKSEAARKRKFKKGFLPMTDCADPRNARVCTFFLRVADVTLQRRGSSLVAAPRSCRLAAKTMAASQQSWHRSFGCKPHWGLHR